MQLARMRNGHELQLRHQTKEGTPQRAAPLWEMGEDGTVRHVHAPPFGAEQGLELCGEVACVRGAACRRERSHARRVGPGRSHTRTATVTPLHQSGYYPLRTTCRFLLPLMIADVSHSPARNCLSRMRFENCNCSPFTARRKESQRWVLLVVPTLALPRGVSSLLAN
ncbi:hypothetical protein J6590_012646 [Homalodisca vitripennis]|nr:hypothetical protein J6590_012646 [Homalodisca vitripennis]